jgi:hypothetical protein
LHARFELIPMSINFALTLALLNVSSMRAARVLLALYALELGAEPLTIGCWPPRSRHFPAVAFVARGQDRRPLRGALAAHDRRVGRRRGHADSLFHAGLTAIFVAAAMNGLSFAIYNVSLQNVVGLLSTARRRTRNFSNYSMSMSVANFIGPLIAGFTIQHSAIPPLPQRGAAIARAGRAGSRLGRRAARRQAASRARGGGIRDMLAAPGVRRTLATSSLLQTGQDLFQFYLPVYGHAIGLSPSPLASCSR